MRKREHRKVCIGDLLYCKCPGINRNVEIKDIAILGKQGNYPLFFVDAPEGEVWLTHKFFTKPTVQ